MKRIGLFFDRSYVDAHSCFTELAKQLSLNGYLVDVYHIPNPYNPPPVFFDPNIRVLTFPRSKIEKLHFWANLISSVNYKYIAVIGTPYEGIFLAYQISWLFRIPYFYLADEIFDPLTGRHSIPERIRKRGARINKNATASIALGAERYDQQARINGLLENHRRFIIPNAPSGSPLKLRSHYFRDLFAISDSKPIVVFIGTLSWNLASGLFELSKSFTNKPYHLVFHTRTKGLMGNELHPFVHISDIPIPSTMLNYVLSSADIGLVLYDKDSKVEAENALTGGKIGNYLKNNLPLIAGNVEGLKFVEEKGIGVYLDNINNLDSAVNKIITNKNQYERNIAQVYKKTFDYSLHFAEFMSYLKVVTE